MSGILVLCFTELEKEKKNMDHVWVDLNGMAHEAFKGRSRLITASSQSHNEWLPGSLLL